MASVPGRESKLPDRSGVALGGFMGSGKSSVGRLLAVRLSLPFADVDEILHERFGPIPTQFERDGEASFRRRERDVITELCDGIPRVVATGGGAWVDPENRDALRRCYRLVVLTAPLDVLRDRVGRGAGRPLWNDAVEERFRARQVAYRDAERVIDTGRLSIEEVVEEIVRWT